jgi:UDP-N-acetylglucosamine--N-acetylmuramyl-(pentapeptide) pyrophosphoryl-undecaprenol N-acetylglucosamine transferase
MKNNNLQASGSKNCFYICGLTGGPFFPIPAIIEQIGMRIPSAKPILIGVKNSYESRLSEQLKYDIEYLPRAKLDILSFKNLGFLEIVHGIFGSIVSILLVISSFAKCIFLLIKYRPIMIYSTGSFLAVPMLWAAKLTNVFKFTNAKLIVHQQDATVGLANKLTANLADLRSCVFQYTKDKYPQFQNAALIPNPIITAKYNANNPWQDKDLESFVKNKTINKPLLLIFGGGSGAATINTWVNENINEITKNYRVIHLTGLLQKEKLRNNQAEVDNSPLEGWQSKTDGVLKSDNSITTKNPNNTYYTQTSVLQDMPVLLASVDMVICRAGLGSISELSLLNKSTFLVPLPNSHQEQNAELISLAQPNFKILDKKDMANWLVTIANTKFKGHNNFFDTAALNQYYIDIAAKIS